MINGSGRPYRLWDEDDKKPVRWRCYSDEERAHWGALKECRWGSIGNTITVYDVRDGRFLGSYTLGVSEITFVEGQ